MMQQLLDNWPSVIIAQLLGVLLAWGVDALGWTWRRDENIVFGFNMTGLIVGTPIVVLWALFAPYSSYDVQRLWGLVAALMLWLSLVAWLQKQQWQITLRAAFFGAMMQLGVFAIVLCLAGAVSLLGSKFSAGWFSLSLLVSMLTTYFLLTLFRPSLFLLWVTIRQSFKKNRPLR